MTDKRQRLAELRRREVSEWNSGDRCRYWRSKPMRFHGRKGGDYFRPATVLLQDRRVKAGQSERRQVAWIIDGDQLLR
eukprot:9570062-Prorocentrum_lima.AAC.1